MAVVGVGDDVVVPDAVGVGVAVGVGDGVILTVGLGVGVGGWVLGVEGGVVPWMVVGGGATTSGEPVGLLGVRVAVTEGRGVVGRSLVGVGDVVGPVCSPGLLPALP